MIEQKICKKNWEAKSVSQNRFVRSAIKMISVKGVTKDSILDNQRSFKRPLTSTGWFYFFEMDLFI